MQQISNLIMKKLLFLFLGLSTLSIATSCRNEEDTENLPLYTNADRYIKDSDGARYVINSAQLIGKKAKNSSETNEYTIILTGTEDGVTRTVKLYQTFPFNDKLDGGFSTTSSIRNLSDSQSKFTRGTTEITDFEFGSSSIVDLDAHNFRVIFNLKSQGGETITGTYTGQFQYDVN